MKPGRNARGFSLLVVTFVIALVAIASVVLLNMVTVDQTNLRHQRQRFRARELSEGALMEIVNDVQVAEDLPNPTSGNVEMPYQPSAQSAYRRGAEETYEARIKQVRFVPVLESSITKVTAVVYQIETEASIRRGEATSRVDAEAYRVVGLPAGKVLPRVHAR